MLCCQAAEICPNHQFYTPKSRQICYQMVRILLRRRVNRRMCSLYKSLRVCREELRVYGTLVQRRLQSLSEVFRMHRCSQRKRKTERNSSNWESSGCRLASSSSTERSMPIWGCSSSALVWGGSSWDVPVGSQISNSKQHTKECDFSINTGVNTQLPSIAGILNAMDICYI